MGRDTGHGDTVTRGGERTSNVSRRWRDAVRRRHNVQRSTSNETDFRLRISDLKKGWKGKMQIAELRLEVKGKKGKRTLIVRREGLPAVHGMIRRWENFVRNPRNRPHLGKVSVRLTSADGRPAGK